MVIIFISYFSFLIDSFPAKTDGPIQARPPDIAPRAIGFSAFNPKEIVLRAGEDLRIPVPFVGSPLPQVTFAKGGDDIKPDGNTQITVKDGIAELFMPKVKGGDSGLYSCTLKNHLGQETVPIKVLVVDKPGLILRILVFNKINKLLLI
jgi:titin